MFDITKLYFLTIQQNSGFPYIPEPPMAYLGDNDDVPIDQTSIDSIIDLLLTSLSKLLATTVLFNTTDS